jgi:hypothetical protein
VEESKISKAEQLKEAKKVLSSTSRLASRSLRRLLLGTSSTSRTPSLATMPSNLPRSWLSSVRST